MICLKFSKFCNRFLVKKILKILHNMYELICIKNAAKTNFKF